MAALAAKLHCKCGRSVMFLDDGPLEAAYHECDSTVAYVLVRIKKGAATPLTSTDAPTTTDALPGTLELAPTTTDALPRTLELAPTTTDALPGTLELAPTIDAAMKVAADTLFGLSISPPAAPKYPGSPPGFAGIHPSSAGLRRSARLHQIPPTSPPTSPRTPLLLPAPPTDHPAPPAKWTEGEDHILLNGVETHGKN
ncbi:hypothetical protein GQ457_05G007470 [Hibiscus cannabinus]